MNYRHAFHAGNFADVLKHAVLVRMLVHLRAKEKPFRVVDTHAGRGAYDLSGEEASRTGEWRDGIARLADLEASPLASFLAPYVEAVESWRAAHGRLSYPGSPALTRHFLRHDDRLIAVEAQERIFGKLAKLFPAGDRAKALRLDGYTAWGAFVPPKERRGLVIVDPPYEQPDEFEEIAKAFAAAARKWPSGMTLIWYPVKDPGLVERFARRLQALALADLWRVELDVGEGAEDEAGLRACGLILHNPPWTLPEELGRILPALALRLAQGPGARGTCRPLGPARKSA